MDSLPLTVEDALAHREAGRYPQAIETLRAWLAEHDRDAVAWAHLAQVLSLTRQEEAATAALETALAADPAHPVVQRNLARLFLRRKQPQQALQAAHAALQTQPADPESQLVLASSLVSAGDAGKALALIDSALALQPTYAEAFALRARLKQGAGDATGALQDAQKAMQLKPYLPSVAAMTASLRYRFNDLQGAIEALDIAVAREPDNVEYLVALGEFKRQANQPEAAIALLERAVSLAPAHAPGWTNLGTALQQAGRTVQARAAYKKALALNPAQAEVSNNLGALAAAEKRHDEAIGYLRLTIATRPDFVQARINLGIALQELGDSAEALTVFNEAVRRAPTLPAAHRNLGDALRALGRADEARLSYQCVLELDPTGVGLQAAVWMAVGHYLEGDFARCQAMLAAAEPVLRAGDAYTDYRAYWIYLVQLGLYYERIGRPPAAAGDATLHVVGESHSLSVHGVPVSFAGRQLRGVARWIVGCKQWHLGNPHPNRFKHQFDRALRTLPAQSTVLLTIGEIDCRPDEGIGRAAQKSPGLSLSDIARATAQAYVAYAREKAAPYGHTLIIGGVPATKASRAERTHITPAHIQMVRDFNAALRTLSADAGLGFLDVYALTDRGDGLATEDRHIDDYHLRPEAYTEAFDRLAAPRP